MTSGVYIIVNPKGFIYIGQSKDVNKRLKGYQKNCSKNQTRLYRSLNKYGAINHNFSTLIECEITHLDAWEKFYIKLFDSFESKHGLNLRSGGNCSIQSTETKKRMSAAQKGKVISNEHIERLRAINTGRIRPQNEKDAISLSMKSVVRTQSHRLNISISSKSSAAVKNNIANMQEVNKKPVINLLTREIFNSVKEASLFYGITYSSLTQSIRRQSANTIFAYL